MAAAEQLPALATRPPPPSRSPPTTRDVAWVVEWPDDRGLAKVKKADSTLLENRFLQHSGVLHDVPLLLAPNDPEEDGGELHCYWLKGMRRNRERASHGKERREREYCYAEKDWGRKMEKKRRRAKSRRNGMRGDREWKGRLE